MRKRRARQYWIVIAAVLLGYLGSYYLIRSNSYSNKLKIASPSIRPTIYFGIGEEALLAAYTSPTPKERERLDRRSELLWWLYSPIILIDERFGSSDIGAGTNPLRRD